ncbi:hypothetical protein Bca52824_017943 [Brassica carinata]|uniref:Uncharacterized protein n=1 Tax=Brassica carinata TaxID=52824 RepID=A0A8X7VNT5_BRACI|nr:hypothetical protein Bca52824_017943 [Brassica carinata]
MTGRGKRGGKRQNKKKNNSTREKVQEHNPAPIAEEFSGGNETQTDHHSATSQTESQLNHDNEIEEEVETENSPEKLEKEAAKEPKETPTPPRGRTKAAARRSSRIGYHHRPKAIAVRNRPRKSTDPKKFTTPEQTTRTRARSRWVSSPFTEADTDEIEGRKKKPRTEA